jgi:hypothetical protein
MDKELKEMDFADIDLLIYSKYLNGVSIENITHWVNWYSPAAQFYKTNASPININEIIDQMNEILL